MFSRQLFYIAVIMLTKLKGDFDMIHIEKINDNEEKSNIADYILRELPDWFGIEESIVEYADGVRAYDFYAVSYNGKTVGFISVKSNNAYTSEIYVMGILDRFHNQGIGAKLVEKAQEELIKNNIKFLMVKTLGTSHPDKHYSCTRKFYSKVGFYPLEEIKEIWGEKNPCLIMVKNLDIQNN